MCVALVEDAALPSLLVARVRKEIMRSLAFVTGGAYMTTMDPLMRDVTKPGDLDALPSEELGLEILNKFPSAAPCYGLKPWHVSTYAKACQQGWAAAPSNDVQKAIWNKVHQIPTEPLKIKPETKKVAE